MKILFIGLGHMSSALIKGIIKNKNEFEIYGNHYDENKLNIICNNLGIKPMFNLKKITEIDIIVLGVKPNQLAAVGEKLKDLDLSKKTIVSMLSGVSIEKIKNNLLGSNHIVRIMPNINAEIQKSNTGLCSNDLQNINTKNTEKLFSLCGSVEYVTEDLFTQFTVSAGCMPAYVLLFAKAFSQASTKSGIDEKQAVKIILETIIGTAQFALKSEKTLQELINSVCVPGGITIEGLNVLLKTNFEENIEAAFNAAIKKDKNH